MVRSVPAGTGAPNTALTHPRELPCDRFLCESPPMIGRTADAFGTALAPRHGSSFLPLRLLFPRSWATPLSGSPPKLGTGLFCRSDPPARPPDSAYPPANPFRFPPASGGTLEPGAFSHSHTQADHEHLTFLTAATSALFLERLCSPERPKLPFQRDWISVRFL